MSTLHRHGTDARDRVVPRLRNRPDFEGGSPPRSLSILAATHMLRGLVQHARTAKASVNFGTIRGVTRVQTFDNRFWLLGPVIWFLAIEFYVVQVVVATAWTRPYDWLRDPISDLGNTACKEYHHRWVCSPWHGAMNLSFIALGGLMIAGFR